MTLPPAPDRWTIDLANTERMEAIAAFGFTERQARFLVNVLLHSGVFVERQDRAFAGIVHGQKSTDFIKTLVERRFASARTDSAAPPDLVSLEVELHSLAIEGQHAEHAIDARRVPVRQPIERPGWQPVPDERSEANLP